MRHRSLALVLSLGVVGTGCFRGGAGFRVFEAAVITAAIISTVEPPPPRVVYVPPPREGYVWQAGYWSRQGGDWVWIDGGWVAQRPNFVWQPTHWEQQPDGNWQLIQGQWVPAQ